MSVVYSPIDGSALCDVPDAGRAEVDRALSRAQAAQEEWAQLNPTRRGRLLCDVGRLMESRAQEFVECETGNLGAPVEVTRASVLRAASTFTYFGGMADKVLGTVIPTGSEFHTYTRREPYGIVVAIVPWNAPIIFATKKMAPALAMGNVCILKPAQETPLSALLLQNVFDECGVPPGVAQVLTGGRETGAALTSDDRVGLIVFTGHDKTGIAIAKAAAERLIPVALELGGKSAQLLFADADLDRALKGISHGIFENCGQACIAGSRLIVEEPIYADVVDRLAQRTTALKVGDPRLAGTDVGPQATATQRDKTVRMIDQAVADGARIVAQADLPADSALSDGYYVRPTVLADAVHSTQIVQEEVFGPVLTVSSFGTEEEAVLAANGTEYGLAAGLWTSDSARVHRIAARLVAGTVWVNTYKNISDLVPFGGVGRSGYGREGGTSAVELYTRVKSVWVSQVS
ncbi:aldehyde dehydrogenase family protein [Jatrophihabitans cynanchi]|uniref:Aldehyde dehydrogenase family protein n=1 Tax=Jatrophihabitans cynanchi TaxID=2944128 RepID=A0ABY7K2B8_9ACTN|nr:aldehyde dehydrogenase family protein [Jatrophihabitans sp. SB3-54]WAX58989.1 aldehyde dehydrogenase family protein [Jatrophihabitans sp. SB3-54]